MDDEISALQEGGFGDAQD
jgi:hypothetical protein